MDEEKEPTQADVEAFLRSRIEEKFKNEIDEIIRGLLTTPLSMFGKMNALQMGEKHGWHAVMGSFRRMYGG